MTKLYTIVFIFILYQGKFSDAYIADTPAFTRSAFTSTPGGSGIQGRRQVSNSYDKYGVNRHNHHRLSLSPWMVSDQENALERQNQFTFQSIFATPDHAVIFKPEESLKSINNMISDVVYPNAFNHLHNNPGFGNMAIDTIERIIQSPITGRCDIIRLKNLLDDAANITGTARTRVLKDVLKLHGSSGLVRRVVRDQIIVFVLPRLHGLTKSFIRNVTSRQPKVLKL